MLDQSAPLRQPAAAAGTPTLDVRVISLTKATERRRLIKQQFDMLPRPWSFFDAQTGLDHPGLIYDETRVRRHFGQTLTRPQLAVWSSHCAVMSDFLETSDSDYLLVFEDDVIYDTAFPLDDLLGFCRGQDINYIRLYGMYAARSTQLSFFFDRAVIRYKSSPLGAQAYVVSKQGARAMLRACADVICSIDIAMDTFWKTGLPIYSVFPFPVIERFSPSSIPMPDDQPLGGVDKAALTANRVGRKLSKVRANVAQRSADRRIRDGALDFVQVGEDHLRSGK